ncbi:MAG: (d)CMP kinase [Desulfuromonadales bacterium]|nr:(d)CMP kinase [Desulfuromonadales bacterium]
MKSSFCSAGKMIVAIDGPSGAGKSTITKKLADRIGYINIDTGAMFRSVALLANRAGIECDDDKALEKLCKSMSIKFERTNGSCSIIVNGEDVSSKIRTPEISILTSAISANMVVRDFLLKYQRNMAVNKGVVLEGRDIGTVVFPDADIKFYLTASVEERGRRRFMELQAKGEDVTLNQTIEAVKKRDEQDANRKYAPLRQADDAIVVDSTSLTFDEVVDKIESMIKEKAGCNC